MPTLNEVMYIELISCYRAAFSVVKPNQTNYLPTVRLLSQSQTEAKQNQSKYLITFDTQLNNRSIVDWSR